MILEVGRVSSSESSSKVGGLGIGQGNLSPLYCVHYFFFIILCQGNLSPSQIIIPRVSWRRQKSWKRESCDCKREKWPAEVEGRRTWLRRREVQHWPGGFFGSGQQLKSKQYLLQILSTIWGPLFQTSDTAIFLRATSLGVIGEALRAVANIVTSACEFYHMIN